ncbi:MAG: nicotinate-nucleotide adenylyltransferase [Deltaproteobacteria bacterium]|nr:nicotinate-nucleotide adenylyltransferase [Deltaproteobacteria bacterium]
MLGADPFSREDCQVVTTGVIHGRFQILHNDHMKYLMAGKSRCEHLVVGITNPDPSLTREDDSDPQRSTPLANPLTYFERYTMIRSVLIHASLNETQFSIVPFPINMPELYQYYVPIEATFYLTIYDQWGLKKLSYFRDNRLKTEVLWQRSVEQKGITAGHVRKMIASGGPWEDLVPPVAVSLIKKWDIPTRLKRLYALYAPD